MLPLHNNMKRIMPSILFIHLCLHESKLHIHGVESLQNLSQLKTLSQNETDIKLRFRDKDANLSSLINIISRKSNPYKNDVQLEFTESKKL